ncbi:MAG: hypothetical protein ACD_41C00111G0003 [uncultured bacterium]|nr:MAG: hypothetical protein ACD_41C00111G0003 [uncultured bacterium]HBY74001.1 hypothetical protein [Candidatus Kerfeldbacteria bacterium]
MNIACAEEYRCPNDHKLLFKGFVVDGEIEVKCRSCRELVTVHGNAEHSLICKKVDCPNRVR